MPIRKCFRKNTREVLLGAGVFSGDHVLECPADSPCTDFTDGIFFAITSLATAGALSPQNKPGLLMLTSMWILVRRRFVAFSASLLGFQSFIFWCMRCFRIL